MEKLVLYFILFIIYSFIGWIIDCLYDFFRKGKLINRGFLIGPLCPIYGVGSLLIVTLLSKYQSHPIALFILTAVLCATIEYFTSLIMELIFKNRWWDYSDFKFNLNGRICLETTIPFGLGGMGVIYISQPILMFLINKIPYIILLIVSIIIAVLLIVDICISFDIIINLKNISKNIKNDSTEHITKKVKAILSKRGLFSRRLIKAFPTMKIKITNIKKRKEKYK